jgi:hypothetical protein
VLARGEQTKVVLRVSSSLARSHNREMHPFTQHARRLIGSHHAGGCIGLIGPEVCAKSRVIKAQRGLWRPDVWPVDCRRAQTQARPIRATISRPLACGIAISSNVSCPAPASTFCTLGRSEGFYFGWRPARWRNSPLVAIGRAVARKLSTPAQSAANRTGAWAANRWQLGRGRQKAGECRQQAAE